MRSWTPVAIVLGAYGLAAPGAGAHHSFAAGYDGEQQVTVTGAVTQVDWANPHMHFSLDVKGDDGVVTNWRFEGYPPNMLVRQGWTRDETLQVGAVVTVFGWRARNEPTLGAARWVTFADGKRLAAGPPAGTGGR
jgi:Family of unknown function (DUF6152)